MVTAYDQPALGGVYKLAATRSGGGIWQYRIKLSEQAIKISTPGVLQVRRFSQGDRCEADMIFDEEFGIEQPTTIVDPLDHTRLRPIPSTHSSEDLLVPVFRAGKPVYTCPELETIQHRAKEQLGKFHSGIKRFINPHEYPVGLDRGLHDRKTALILQARQHKSEDLLAGAGPKG